MATGSVASAGRSPNKHPRTGSEEDSMDFAALWDRAADRFSACMDTKVDSMMDRLEKRIDGKIDSKLSPVMDRLSVLEKTSKSTRCGSSSLSDNGGLLALLLHYLLLLIWKSRGGADFGTETHIWRSSPNCDWELVLILTP